MGARAQLDRDEVRAILSLYHLEGPDDFGAAGGASVWVEVGAKKYVLRVLDHKRIDDMIFEKEVLGHLERHGLPVPRLVRNVAQGTFTPWSSRGRYASLFEFLPGRPVGVFELRAQHARRIGHLCARMHRELGDFRKRADPVLDPGGIEARLRRVRRAVETKRLPRRFHPHLEVIEAAWAACAPMPADLPGGVVHGRFGLSALRFLEQEVVGLVDFEGAGRGRWISDLAAAVHEVGWRPATDQRGGPAGRFDASRVRALLRAYHRVRPLEDAERRALPDELRLHALDRVLDRICLYEMRPPSRRPKPYRDYRHYVARLEALQAGAADRFAGVS